MKKAITIVLCCICQFFFLRPAAAGTHLFVLSGQSNMVRLNAAASFIPTVQAALPDDACVVVKSARGGTPISAWVDGARPCYHDLLAAVAAADCAPDTITFVWMQGESDATAGLCGAYEGKLRRLISDLRNDLDFAGMGAVIGRIHGERDAFWNTVRAAQVAVAESDARSLWVDTDDLRMRVDGLHFSVAGYEQLGGRLAQAAVMLATGIAAEIVVEPGVQKPPAGHDDDDGGCFIRCLGGTVAGQETKNRRIRCLWMCGRK